MSDRPPHAGRHSLGLALLAAALVLHTGCGSRTEPTPPPPAGADAPGAPSLLRTPARAGEVVVSEEASPAAHGPFEFDGRYRVRFVQYAPEDPGLDFASQTPLVAKLSPPRPGPRARPLPLFRSAARSGERVLEIDGSYTVEVVFGDYPYVIRFTPAGRPAERR